MGRRRADRELEKAFARAVRAGQEAERQSLLAAVASGIFSEEVREVQDALSGGYKAALSYMARVRDLWRRRWTERLSGPLLRVMQTSELPTNRGPVTLGLDVSNPKLRDYFEGYVVEVSGQITDTTQKRLTEVIRKASEEGLSVPEAAKRIEEVGEEFRGSRAELIARNELHRAAVGAGEINARESGVVVSRTWLSALDERVRPLHRTLNGKTVGMDEPFAPGVNSPADEIACRCTLLYGLNPEMLEGRTA